MSLNNNNSRCPRCGKAFECGSRTGTGSCWCFSFPPVVSPVGGGECFCPECLAADIAGRISHLKTKLSIHKGDITKLRVDAIVNAANGSLLGGGGVDGAIHRAAGPKLLEECRLLNGCQTGEAKATKGYQLPAAYVIHTVGPVWKDGHNSEPELLAKCYQNSLKIAEALHAKTIAFPAISCGVYGFPVSLACSIALSAVILWVIENDVLDRIVFVCYDSAVEKKYRELFALYGMQLS